jgi:hypothetical protein
MIVHNSFVASGPILAGQVGKHPPENVSIINNLFLHPTKKILKDPTGSERIFGNATDIRDLELPKGISKSEVSYEQNKDGLFQLNDLLTSSVPGEADWTLLDIPTLDDDPQIALDIMQHKREPGKLIIGCQVPGATLELRPYVSSENTGPGYLKW